MQEKVNQVDSLNINLKKQVAMLKTRLDKLEDENDRQENELRISRSEAEKAKSNVNILKQIFIFCVKNYTTVF